MAKKSESVRKLEVTKLDTLGLIWGVVVHAANLAEGADPLLGYLNRMKRYWRMKRCLASG
jgi:hypothetical protein